MSRSQIDDAFTLACSSLDTAWQLVRELQLRAVAPPSVIPPLQHRVDTLSTSLAEPQQYAVEIALANVRCAIQSESDRTALVAVIYACLAQGLINGPTADRLVREYLDT